MIEFLTNDVKMTQDLGFSLGQRLEPGDIIFLSGQLGSGKTQFTKGIARGLMAEQEPRSPTFVLLAMYRGRLDIYHADLYRLDGGYAEVFDIGLDEVMHSNGVTIVEWAEKAGKLLHQPTANVVIKNSGASHELRCLRGNRFCHSRVRMPHVGHTHS